MRSGVGHHDPATEGIAEQGDFVEAEVRAHGVEIGHLRIHGLRRVGGHVLRSAGAALVVEDDQAMLGHLLPHIVHQHVGVGKAGPAVHGDDGQRGAARAIGQVRDIDLIRVDDTGGMRHRLRRQQGRSHETQENRAQIADGLRRQIGNLADKVSGA